MLLIMDNKTRFVEMMVASCYLAGMMVALTLMLVHGLWKNQPVKCPAKYFPPLRR
jgi:hypothetical protein